MARLITPLILDHSVRRKFKKVFAQLSDDYTVRSQILEENKVADIAIEGPNNSWLFIGWHSDKPSQKDVLRFTSFYQKLANMFGGKVSYLAVTTSGKSLFDLFAGRINGVAQIEQTSFFKDGVKIIKKYIAPVSIQGHSYIKNTLFNELSIHAACTARRPNIVRDTSAKLHSFFLDYDQESATKLDIIDESRTMGDLSADNNSVRLINGVAGSGKTLILINRAILYCKKYPKRSVRMLIHNIPVTKDVNYKIAKYLNGLPSNLKVQTFHSFALAQQRKVFGFTKPVFTQKDLSPFKSFIFRDEQVRLNELKLSKDQVWDEIEYINDYLIANKEIYLDIDRQGRGFALQKAQREIIWYFYKKAVKKLSSRCEGYLPSLYIKELCLSSEAGEKIDKYDHIMVDEAQFFSPSWLQLIIKSLSEKGRLFLCADPNQGFLKNRLSWKNIGLNVRGRTKKLTYSYRTTYEILSAADSLLEYIDESSEDYLTPDLEKMAHGSRPQIIYSNAPQDEKKRLINELKALFSEKNPPDYHQVMVLCSDQYNPWNLKEEIEQALGSGKTVNCADPNDREKNFGERIRVVTINSCTGMESAIVFVLGVGDLLTKCSNIDLTEDEQGILYRENLRKLYVAMTRAGQKLILLSTELLPEKVKALTDSSYTSN